ncbi:serine hydrolase domain-containing protein [Psychromicrobium xiongbiense]|uniref:serine hydrolase domain-containing protein n=1 Tax=Psychromicrobium xiongbiense TaxID=3051184 RepID=UPI0025572D78|nr:serine hydrolase domain-containing protein [Psychromicrobium sp. YIM S02556]
MTQGFVADGYQPLADAFDSLFTDGLDDGASLTVYRHGKLAVDLWGGTDPHDGTPWEKDSATVGFSTTKAAATILALRLVERGLLDLDASVADYWPEFAAAGKESITVRQVLQHRGALPYLEGVAEDFYTPGKAEAIIATQTPAYPVNSAFVYHAVTFGTLVGELIRRVTGQSVSEVMQQEISQPLGIDFWIGLPESAQRQFRRITYGTVDLPVAPPAEVMAQLPPATAAEIRTGLQLLSMFHEDSREAAPNTLPFLQAQMAGANGVNNGRALATMYAALLGEVNGVRLLSADTVAMASRLGTADIERPPLADGTPQDRPRWGVGFHLDDAGTPMLGEGSFGHAGMGGRLGFAHAASGVAFGYVGQRMQLDDSLPQDLRLVRLMKGLTESLG